MFKLLQSSLKPIASYPAKLKLGHESSRAIATTGPLYAEPPKKKRRIDPAVFKVRVERKIKKAEREIAKLESEPRQLAPIMEYQLTKSDIRDLKARPQHTLEEFSLAKGSLKAANRLWTFYRNEEVKMAHRQMARIEAAQTRALDKLKTIDSELYDETMTVEDTVLIPYATSHMRKETGPDPNYKPPDGYIKDVSKEWIM